MDLYFKTITLNKDSLYLYELKGHTKHLNIFINKEDVFIVIPAPPPKKSGAHLSTKQTHKMEV